MKLSKVQKGIALTALVLVAIGGAATLSGGKSSSTSTDFYEPNFHGGLASTDSSSDLTPGLPESPGCSESPFRSPPTC